MGAAAAPAEILPELMNDLEGIGFGAVSRRKAPQRERDQRDRRAPDRRVLGGAAGGPTGNKLAKATRTLSEPPHRHKVLLRQNWKMENKLDIHTISPARAGRTECTPHAPHEGFITRSETAYIPPR